MPCSRRNPGSSSNNTVLGTSALPMYHSTYQLEPAVSGFRWMSVDRYWVKILNPDNDLRRSLAFGGRPWKVEVERVKGIEPLAMCSKPFLCMSFPCSVVLQRLKAFESASVCSTVFRHVGSRFFGLISKLAPEVKCSRYIICSLNFYVGVYGVDKKISDSCFVFF